MEENKVATDSSAPNSPELTRLSGEQAEERTAREGRAKEWLDENDYYQLDPEVERPSLPQLLAKYAESECSRLASHVQELESDVRRWKDASDANRDEAMKQQDLKLEQKQIAARLASRVEELENLIAKHSRSLNSADSASNGTSNYAAKETR